MCTLMVVTIATETLIIYGVAYLNIVHVFGTTYYAVYHHCMDMEHMMFINAEQAKWVHFVP